MLLTVSNLTVSFGIRNVLSGISFAVADNDRIGVVGVNGSGKSTLFRAITGEMDPDGGEIYLSKDKSVGILHQNDAFELTPGADDTVLGQMLAAFPELLEKEAELAELETAMRKASPEESAVIGGRYAAASEQFTRAGGLEFRSRCRAILGKTGFPETVFNQSVKQLSGGQRTRLALARLLAREPDLLLLDEPTNHLDLVTLNWLEDYLRSYRKAFLVISHDRFFLDRVTQKTLEIEYSGARLYQGNYTSYTKHKKTDREIAQHAYDVQQKEIARIEAYIEQQRRWNRERNIIAAESREKALQRMERVAKPKDDPSSIRFSITSSGVSGNDVLMIRELSMSFPGHPLFRDLNLDLHRGERLFLVGPNGCGKSTLLKLILGRLTPQHGEIEFGYNVKYGYYDQENQNLHPDNSVLEELWGTYPDRTQTEIRNVLARFLFRGDDIERSVSVLSGGERARLTFAKLILAKMNLLVLDEPTNHMDIPSREALEEALAEFDGTVLAVSHDRYFIDRLATHIVDMEGGSARLYPVRRTGEGFTEFMEEKERLRQIGTISDPAGESPITAEPKSGTKEQYLAGKAALAEARKQQRAKEQAEAEIRKIESELSDIAEALAGDAGRDFETAAELDRRQQELEERLLALYELTINDN